MKYDVTHACGHNNTVELYGPNKERERKIKWMENTVCSACYRAEQEEDAAKTCDAVEMPYRQYKQDYADCRAKTGSYNKDSKTIIVYVPLIDPTRQEQIKEMIALGLSEEIAKQWVDLGADGVQEILDRMITGLERDKVEITPDIEQNLALGRKIIEILRR